jgi:hypothetical protein
MTTEQDPGPESVTLRLMAALDRTWNVIRARHPEVSEVVMTMASASIGGCAGGSTLAHYATRRWQRGGDLLDEMFVAAEGLANGPEDVLVSLLHEAAHSLADARKIQDTSRQGRYHNARYRTLATELGLAVAQVKVPDIGWSGTTLTDATAAAYAAQVADLKDAIVAWRHPELGGTAGGDGDTPRANNNNGLTAVCECPRRFRISPKQYDAGGITCDVCGTPFVAVEPDDDPDDPAADDDD